MSFGHSLTIGIYQNAPAPLQVFKLNGHSLMVNQAFKDLFKGAPASNYNIHTDPTIDQYGNRELVNEAFSLKPVKIPAKWYLNNFFINDDWLGLECEFFPIQDDEESYVGVFYKDVTKQMRLLDEINQTKHLFEKSEEVGRYLFESELIAFFVTDFNGNVRKANTEFCRLTGYSQEEIDSGLVNWRHMTPAEWQSADDVNIARVLSTGRCPPFEKEYIVKDGSRRPVLVGGTCLSTKELLAFAFDLTEYKNLQRSLLQSERLDAVGRLAGGVAHDFNNVLTVIQSCSEQVLRSKLGDFEERKVSSILNAAERGKKIVQQLLTFSGNQQAQADLVDLNQIILQLKDMLIDMMGSRGNLSIDLSPIHPKVRASSTQIEQVILNLVTNARDAIGPDGRITIKTSTARNFERKTFPSLPEGTFTCLSIEDNGSGVSLQNASRIFEPFFTTKAVGKGTGLGLSIVYGIAKECGGDVIFSSPSGQGSKFTFILPSETHS